MTKAFNELHEHLKSCVDSDNDSFTGITEDGSEFNMFEWAYGLSVKAKREIDSQQERIAKLEKALTEIDPYLLDGEGDVFKAFADAQSIGRCSEDCLHAALIGFAKVVLANVKQD